MKNLQHTKTAIIIFSLSQEAENIRKPFLKKNDTVNQLNKLIKEKVSSLGVDYYHLTEDTQQGQTFGERYVNSISAIFDKGYDNVITVGNDTLGLEKKHIKIALKAIENNQVSIGPSFDGGFYLLSIHKDQFNKETFLSLPWESSQLCRALKTLLLKNNILSNSLPYLYDIDEEIDIIKNISSTSYIKVKILRLLQNLLVIPLTSYAVDFKRALTTSVNFFYNKGSPFVCN